MPTGATSERNANVPASTSPDTRLLESYSTLADQFQQYATLAQTDWRAQGEVWDRMKETLAVIQAHRKAAALQTLKGIT